MKPQAPLQGAAQQELLRWFKAHQRPWPWRENREPYRIWISETMLQQTTSTAVKPFFERFIARFPTLESLSLATQEQVYEVWAGLGYYSRARNLLKAAQQLQAAGGFPRSYQELLTYPGLGPYTARSVASLAFGQKVGVIDGNVIRVLSRLTNQKIQWWKTAERQQLQDLVDALCFEQDPYFMNQALMELGATVCLPKTPACMICPVAPSCKGLKAGNLSELPLKKPKKQNEIWEWKPFVREKSGRLAFVKDPLLPFLKDHWVLPGQAQKLKTKPKTFDFKHNITHHEIYVTLSENKRNILPKETLWLCLDEVQGQIPASLIQKALKFWAGSSLLSSDSAVAPQRTKHKIKSAPPARPSKTKKKGNSLSAH